MHDKNFSCRETREGQHATTLDVEILERNKCFGSKSSAAASPPILANLNQGSHAIDWKGPQVHALAW